MKVGWNLGNTLEAICGENAWGNPNTSQTLINAVKNGGFNTVRLPCAWDCHTNNGVIDAAWIARVKAVVDYCINDNLYVVLNIHWDGGWLENHVNKTDQAAVNAKQKNYWTQIANYFKNYNEHLLFASANEPGASTAEEMAVLMSYHQTFVDAVRATGGNNSSRTLIVQFPIDMGTTMPSDKISGRLMYEFHDYTPYQYTLMTEDASWGKMFYYWGSGYHSTVESDRNATWGEESYVESDFAKYKSAFVDKGIPVIVGEYAAIQRSNPKELSLHLASRKYWYKYVTNAMIRYGLIPITWETGSMFDRNTGAVKDQDALDAIMQGVGGSNGSGYVTIQNKATGLLIDGMGRTSNGSNAGQWSSSGSNAQKWTMETSGNNVKFKNVATGLYLDGMGRTSNGSIVGQWSSSSSNNQQWVVETSGSYKKIKNVATGLYLDGMSSTTNGSDLALWSSSSSNAQLWTLTTVKSAGANSEELSVVDEGKSDVLYPNPFTSGITLSINNPEQVTSIIVTDMFGRQVEIIDHAAVKGLQTIGSSLKAGTYVVQVNHSGKIQSFTVIKK
jgi:hypothetical protein